MVTEYIFVWVIYPLVDQDNRLSIWVSGLIWNLDFQKNLVTGSQVSNRYLSNRHHTNFFMRDTIIMIPAEKEEINIQVQVSIPQPWSGPLPSFQAVHSTSSVLLCISLQSSNYSIHCNVASGWVAYGILKLYHWLSLVTWETEGLSVLQVTNTCRAKLTCVIWQSHNCAAENARHLGCNVLSSGM